MFYALTSWCSSALLLIFSLARMILRLVKLTQFLLLGMAEIKLNTRYKKVNMRIVATISTYSVLSSVCKS